MFVRNTALGYGDSLTVQTRISNEDKVVGPHRRISHYREYAGVSKVFELLLQHLRNLRRHIWQALVLAGVNYRRCSKKSGAPRFSARYVLTLAALRLYPSNSSAVEVTFQVFLIEHPRYIPGAGKI
jgi:hypothetical protein